MSKIYIVKSGDTLWGISKKHHISVKELARINSLSGRMIHNLRIGQKIYLQNDVNNTNNFETQLKIILMDLSFKPIWLCCTNRRKVELSNLQIFMQQPPF